MIKTKKILVVYVFLLCLLMLFISLSTLNTYPPFFVDEILSLARINSVLSNLDATSWLDKNPFLETINETNKVLQIPYYIFSLPDWIFGGTPSIARMRLVVFCASLVLLLSIFNIANKMGGVVAGCLAVLFTFSSRNFITASHMARPDMIAVMIAYTGLYLSLFANRIIIGLLICCAAFLVHERSIIISLPAFIFCLGTNLKVLCTYRVKRFVLAGILGLSICIYLVNSSLLSWITHYGAIWKGAAIPLASGKIDGIYANIQHTWHNIKYLESPFFLAITILSIFLVIEELKSGMNRSKKNQYLCLLSVILLGLILVDMPLSVKLIYYLPCFYIVWGLQTARLVNPSGSQPRILGWRNLTLLLLISFSFMRFITTASMIAHANQDQCSTEQDKIRSSLQYIVVNRNLIVGEESYFLFIGEELDASWKNIKNYAARNNIKFIEAVSNLGIDTIIFDQGTYGFFSDKPSKIPYKEAFRIDRNEIYSLINNPNTETRIIESKCFGKISVLLLNKER